MRTTGTIRGDYEVTGAGDYDYSRDQLMKDVGVPLKVLGELKFTYYMISFILNVYNQPNYERNQ